MKNKATIIKKYASILFEASGTPAKAEKVLSEFESFISLLDHLSEYGRFLRNPNVPVSAKIKAVDICIKELKIGELLNSFIHLLIQNKRLDLVDLIAKNLKTMIAKAQGIEPVTLITASTMTSKQLDEMRKSLEADLNVKVELDHTTDHSLLAGAMLYFQSYMIDGSYKSKLTKLRNILTN